MRFDPILAKVEAQNKINGAGVNAVRVDQDALYGLFLFTVNFYNTFNKT